MSIPSPSIKLGFRHDRDYQQARQVFERMNYTETGLFEALSIPKSSGLNPNDPVILRRTASGRPIDTFVRLFLLGMPVDASVVAAALDSMSLSSWVEGGFIRQDGNSVTATLKISPFRGLFLAHDFRKPSVPVRQDFVMGVGGATLTLADSTIRRRSRVTLDLGTGSGVLAMLAAAHSDRVIAVDSNPRAREVAELNCRLNGISNVECRVGNLFEPVKDELFDHVISDPPYVISPPSGFLYLDGGMRGDQFCRSIVQGVAPRLTEGGFCQMLCNWPHYARQNWEEDLAAWFAGTRCDVWVLHVMFEEAATYAKQWMTHIHDDNRVASNELFSKWMDYYEQERIEGMHLGIVTLRRTNGRPGWFRVEEAPEKVSRDCGEDISHRFEAQDFLDGHDDIQLLGSRFRCSPNLRLDYHSEPGNAEWKMTASTLKLVEGLAFQSKTDPYTAGLLVRCNGERTIRELLPDLAQALGANVTAISEASLTAVRRFVELGFLLPVN